MLNTFCKKSCNGFTSLMLQTISFQTRKIHTTPTLPKEGDWYNRLWVVTIGGLNKKVGKGRRKYNIKPVDSTKYKFGMDSADYVKNLKNMEALVQQLPSSSYKTAMQLPKPLQKFLARTAEKHQDPQRIIEPTILTKLNLRHAVRGYSGQYLPGRYIGHPINQEGEQTNLHCYVAEIRRVKVKVSQGNEYYCCVIVVCGNLNGLIGWSAVRSQDFSKALSKARDISASNLFQVHRLDRHTILHDNCGTSDRTSVMLERRGRGYGLRAHRLIKIILHLAGIQNARGKIDGPTTCLKNVVTATFQALCTQESHQDLADRTGKVVVEVRPEFGGFPFVVAVPSTKALILRNKALEEIKNTPTEKMSNEMFDPDYVDGISYYQGLHRPRNIQLYPTRAGYIKYTHRQEAHTKLREFLETIKIREY